MSILERINKECEKKHISIKTLEQETGISNGAISKWDTSVPKVDTLNKVAEYLGVTLDYLYSGSVEEKISFEQEEYITLYKNLSQSGQTLCLEYIKGFAKAEGHYKQFIKSDNPICYPDKFETAAFFSNSSAEYAIYKILTEIINTDFFTIIPHVSLCDLFRYKIDEQVNFYKFLGYHVDFAIFDKAYYPVLVIEINGSKHYENAKTIWTDAQKKSFFKYHNIPFISSNWSKKIVNEREYIQNELRDVSIPVYCWECGHIMEKKANTQDNRLFYSCYNLKNHKNHMHHTLNIDTVPNLFK